MRTILRNGHSDRLENAAKTRGKRGVVQSALVFGIGPNFGERLSKRTEHQCAAARQDDRTQQSTVNCPPQSRGSRLQISYLPHIRSGGGRLASVPDRTSAMTIMKNIPRAPPFASRTISYTRFFTNETTRFVTNENDVRNATL